MLRKKRAERRRALRQAPTRPLVLIVDGDADTRELYCAALAALDFEAEAIADVTDAYMRAWSTHPDVVAFEIWHAGRNAWNVIQDLKRDPRTREIPIVILTTQDDCATRDRAAREGCAAFLMKPCPLDVLATTLRDVVAMQCHNGRPSRESICQRLS